MSRSDQKFLIGFASAMVVGGGVLGWLAFSANQKFNDAHSEYENTQGKLKGLQEQRPYPNAENLKVVEAEKVKAVEAARQLQAELAGTGFPLAEMEAAAFQVELKKTIDALSQKATQNNVVLPKDKFNLGFEEYLQRLPDQNAAKPLGRELKSVAWIVNCIVDQRAAELGEIQRTPLAIEKPGAIDKKQEEKDAKAGKTGKAGKKLTNRGQFEISFTAEQRRAREIINQIVACKEQFYVPRRIQIENEKAQGPAKADAAKPEDASKATASTARLNYVLGEEKITVTLNLEAVYFEKPEPAAARKPNAPKAN